MAATRDGMHEGAFQLTNAASDLAEAISRAKTLQASTKSVELKAALADVLATLDDAGASIADFTGEPPELAEFKKQFDDQDKKRLDSIDGANDALHDIDQINDALDTFTTSPAPEDDGALSDLGDALDNATSDLTDAIKAFGGKVEPDDTQAVAPAPDPDKKADPAAKPDL